MADLVLPGGVTPSASDLQPPSKELLALHQIAVNQVGISDILKNIARLLEIQLRIQSNADSRNHWRQRFLEADRREAEAAAGRDVDDVGTRQEEEYDDYPQEYQSLQEREDADREAERGGGFPSEGPLGD